MTAFSGRTTDPDDRGSHRGTGAPLKLTELTGRTTQRRTHGPCSTITLGERLIIRPWIDPVVDDHGNNATRLAIENDWLPVLGPTAPGSIAVAAPGSRPIPTAFNWFRPPH